MAKGERELVDKYSQQQMSDVKSAVTGNVSHLQTKQPGAEAQAESAYTTASPFAQNLAVTGGVSEDEAQAMETSATRGVGSLYDVMANEAKRKFAITGGYGGRGEIAQIARQGGQRQAEAITGAKAVVAGMRQQGRIAGTENLIRMYALSQDQANYVQNAIMQAQKMGFDLTAQDIAMLAEMSKQPGGLSAVIGGIGTLAGAAGSVMTGLGGAKMPKIGG